MTGQAATDLIPSSGNEQQPLVTIITVVYNGYPSIEETFKSVLKLKGSDVEYVVIDGGSSDGTVDIIRKYESCIDHWVSEPDNGIYDAINKAMRAAHGTFLFVLNLGDKLLTIPRPELVRALKEQVAIAVFRVEFSDGRTIQSGVDYRSRFGNTIHHQSAFYRSDLHFEYDTRYRVFADFNLNQQLLKQGRKVMSFPLTVAIHSLRGASNEQKFRSEYFSVIRNNFGIWWMLVGRIYVWQGELRRTLKRMKQKQPRHA